MLNTQDFTSNSMKMEESEIVLWPVCDPKDLISMTAPGAQ